MKNPAAFISYAHRDDAAYGRRITGLRQRLQRMVGAAIGGDFEIFQDCEGIAWGQHWRSRLDEALEEALFLIPILTPSYFNSEPCRSELKTFVEFERKSGRSDRILSLYFLDAPVYEQKQDDLAVFLQERQHRDWRDLRFDPFGSPKVMRALDRLARELALAIHARRGELGLGGLRSDAPVPAPAPEIVSVPAPRSASRFAAPSRSGAPRHAPGTVFRDIDASWCPEMVVIPAGSFVMGSPKDEEGQLDSEGPQHRVTFAAPFGLGKYPVTFEEYDHFCSETKRKKPPDQGWGRARRPVINVSWEDAKAYCTWLSKQTRQLYRLPSEAEWEYACRATTTTPFWTGGTITGEQATFDLNGEHTSTVDGFAANPWGLHDMHGNVREWCEDWWNDNYVGAPGDGSAWLTGTSSGRAVRGGSWDVGPSDLRSAYREGYMLSIRSQDLGFRVSRTLAP